MNESQQKLRERLYETLVGFEDPKELGELLEALFTERKLDDAAQKLDIASRLRRGLGVRTIAKRLEVSTKTVSGINKLAHQRPFNLAFQRWEEWSLRAKH